MKIQINDVEAVVLIGEGVVSIKRKGSAQIVQAKVVATVPATVGVPTRLWLDRLVHAEHETSLGQYPVKGALVTEISLKD